MSKFVQKQEHYGSDVWTNVAMDDLRKQHCLCLNCNGIRECGVANSLYEICKEENLAVCVTRCPSWSAES